MVEKEQAHRVGGLAQPLGGLAIGLARAQETARVVVRDAERSPARGEDRTEHIAYREQTPIGRSLRQRDRMANPPAQITHDDHDPFAAQST
jgi:hypothetical protein